MKTIILAGTAALTLLAGCNQQGGRKTYENADIKLNSFTDSLSFSLGTLVAKNIVQSVPSKDIKAGKLNKDVFFQAMNNYLETEDEVIDEATLMQVVQKFSKEQGDSYKLDNEAFLEVNKSAEGYTVTASGLQYKVLTMGTGELPNSTDKVRVHYTGKLIDGKVFDSSVDRGQPIEFPLNGVIPGWTEGVQLMPIGSKFEFVIPQDLGYGERGAGRDIPPFSTLIFEVELLDIIVDEDLSAEPSTEDAHEGHDHQ